MPSKCAGLILAGGQGCRMGHQDKGLVTYKERALIEYQIDLLKDQVDTIMISANRNLEQYRRYGYPVVTDMPAYPDMGPLGGIYSACHQLPTDIARVQVIPCDTPFLPHDLVNTLAQPLLHDHKAMSVAATPSGEQSIVFQFKRKVLSSLKTLLDDGSNLRLRHFIRQHPHAVVMFEQEEYFINFNDAATLQHWNSL